LTGPIGVGGPSFPVSAGSGNGPIGVFDSGVGGLTVLRALRSALPTEEFIYLGDTARLPYGTKSPQSVVRYSLQCAEALIARGIRCLVVACNTASASALDALRLRYGDIPVIGVIEPGAAAAVSASHSKHIAVIGTEGTIGGRAYQTAIHRLNADVRVTALACSLFVAMAEEGWVEGPIAEAVARRYLEPIFSDALDGVPDTLVLGCTHFPALAAPIRAVLPEHVRIVDSAATIAAAVSRELAVPNHRRGRGGGGGVRWLATDGAARFARVSSTFLGEALRADQIEIIDL
jgi:glutamate racemase